MPRPDIRIVDVRARLFRAGMSERIGMSAGGLEMSRLRREGGPQSIDAFLDHQMIAIANK